MSSAPDPGDSAVDARPLLLIAHSSPILRRGWARRAAALGFRRVSEAADAVGAVAALAESPDVILTSNSLPGAVALDLVSRAREGTMPGSPWIVVVSDRADRASVEAARAAGADRYVLRPIGEGALERALGGRPGGEGDESAAEPGSSATPPADELPRAA